MSPSVNFFKRPWHAHSGINNQWVAIKSSVLVLKMYERGLSILTHLLAEMSMVWIFLYVLPKQHYAHLKSSAVLSSSRKWYAWTGSAPRPAVPTCDFGLSAVLGMRALRDWKYKGKMPKDSDDRNAMKLQLQDLKEHLQDNQTSVRLFNIVVYWHWCDGVSLRPGGRRVFLFGNRINDTRKAEQNEIILNTLVWLLRLKIGHKPMYFLNVTTQQQKLIYCTLKNSTLFRSGSLFDKVEKTRWHVCIDKTVSFRD